MRLPLPPEFPDVDLPPPLVAATVVTIVDTGGLPGTEVHVILPNNYGMSLIHGRRSAYCGEHTVEVLLVKFLDRDTGVNVVAYNTPVRTTGGPGLQGWADAVWLASALTTLSTLPPVL